MYNRYHIYSGAMAAVGPEGKPTRAEQRPAPKGTYKLYIYIYIYIIIYNYEFLLQNYRSIMDQPFTNYDSYSIRISYRSITDQPPINYEFLLQNYRSTTDQFVSPRPFGKPGSRNDSEAETGTQRYSLWG